ncbi:MAG: AAA family ATPase [Deltaproteobacteria bacterium]|jgi:predicted ATP-binding protein involved in virulence|nr:AAA family ATPase [Deltaproteobacteria bacterium]
MEPIIKIESLSLKNYRLFDNFEITFAPRLTVLVGENGSGKTAILDALSIFLYLAVTQTPFGLGSYFFYSLSDFSIIANQDDKVLYNIKLTLPCVSDNCSVNLFFNSKTSNMIKFSMENNNDPKIFPIKSVTSYEFNNLNDFFLNKRPVLVAYKAGRFVTKETTKLITHQNYLSQIPELMTHQNYIPQTTEISNAFNQPIDFASTLTWFNQRDADEARAIRDGGSQAKDPVLTAVREAISKALLGRYVRPRMKGSPPELIIYGKDNDLPYNFNQLSSGFQAMLALVIDLARRMAQSSQLGIAPQESVLNASAIVLIDEIELHLHPAWQQQVIPTLLEIFPNTQFIITTHSPQVLTTIPHQCIRVLEKGQVYAAPEQTEGAEASRLLKEVFDVEPRPQNLSIVETLNRYKNLVYAEKWDSEAAKDFRKQLDEHFGQGDLTLSELDLFIENKKWMKGL